ncbi:MAG: cyclase family protein [Anaerolineales bacterium]
MSVVDISLGLTEQLTVWPGDPPLKTRVRRTNTGIQVTEFALCAHAGTHMDAPRHMLGPSAASIDQQTLDALVGPAVLLDLSTGVAPTETTPLDEAALTACLGEQPPCRLLLRLRPAPMTPETFLTYRPLAVSAARWLVDHGVRLVGLDVPSVDAAESTTFPVHHILLGAGVAIVENLALDEAPAGNWQCACLPLKLVGADGAPVRAVLWR